MTLRILEKADSFGCPVSISVTAGSSPVLHQTHSWTISFKCSECLSEKASSSNFQIKAMVRLTETPIASETQYVKLLCVSLPNESLPYTLHAPCHTPQWL